MTKCKRHEWRIGSFIGAIRKGKVMKIGINVWCSKCNSKLRAFYEEKPK